MKHLPAVLMLAVLPALATEPAPPVAVRSGHGSLVSPRDFGGAGDGRTDDSAAVQKALLSGSVAGLSGGRYRITQRLEVPAGGGLAGVNGGDLWVLGYKTERGGTLIHTRGGGRTGELGGFSYTTTAGKLAPMFVNEDAAVWTYFAERCFNGDPLATLVRETRGGETRERKPNPAATAPYAGRTP